MIPIEKVKLIVNTYETLEKELHIEILIKRILLKNLRNILVLEKLLMQRKAILGLKKKKKS